MAIQIIHVVLGKANPNRMNGVNKVVNSLATAQSDLGYNVSVWGLTKTLVKNYPERNYNTLLFKDVSKFSLPKTIEKQLKTISKDSIFHIHGGFIPQFYFFAKKIKSHGFEYILTPHGAYNTVALQRSAWKKNVYIKLFETYLVKSAKCIHLIGQSEIIGAENVFGKITHTLIPNGQELSYSSAPSKISSQIKIFGFIGRLDIHTKGLDILFEGFSNFIKTSSSNAKLWIVGDGKEKIELENLAKELNITNQVKFWGSQFGEDKNEILKEMDVLCLTSRNEGLPGVVLEAAAMGIPAIVSPETNMGAYIEKNKSGWLLPSNSSKSLSAVFREVNSISEEDQDKMKANAINMIKQQFSWSTISKALIPQYEA